jgi:tetraacyldisaccharide 4'-kinase
MLRSLGFDLEAHGFSDHHSFKQRDFNITGTDDIILMTEKDAVKCRSLGLKNAWYVPVETRLSDEFERILKYQIMNLMKNT